MAGALTRWDPFAEIADLRGRFDRMLDETGSGDGPGCPPSISSATTATSS